MNSKRRHISIYVFLAGLLLLIGCGQQDEKTIVTGAFEVEENELLYVTEADLLTEYTDPIYVDLSEVADGYRIEDGGEYVLSGEYNQTLIIDAHDQMVHLFLDNVTIQTAIGPAIYVKSAGKVIVTLLEDTGNALFDAAYYSDEDLNATMSAECDLTINGEGTLYICGYYKDAIHTKDVFKLLGGTVQLKAKRYGIKGNDGIVLDTDELIVESEKNGCQTSNADKEGKGIIDIRGGEISVVAGEYALSAVADVYIWEGEIYLNSVIGDIYAEGQQYIAEGAIADE